jgi:hypothetical protein
MLSVILLSVVILNVVMLSVNMLSVTMLSAPERCITQASSALIHKHQTRLEMLARDKHYISLQTFVN